MFRRVREKLIVNTGAYLAVGLGNVGAVYEDTRHNAGFAAADRAAARLGIRFDRAECRAYVGRGSIGGETLLLAKPTTYMNLSGQSVAALLKKYSLDLSRLVIVYDDIDLPAGVVRMRKKGSAGTHNGMRSIIDELGSGEFARIRIGVGRPEDGEDLKDFVLGRPLGSDRRLIDDAAELAAEGIELFVREGIDRAMAALNSKKPAGESDE